MLQLLLIIIAIFSLLQFTLVHSFLRCPRHKSNSMSMNSIPPTTSAPTGPIPFSTSEVDKLVCSLRNAALNTSRKRKQLDNDSDQQKNPDIDLIPNQISDIDSINWIAFRSLMEESAHRPHKNWQVTDTAAMSLKQLIGSPDDPLFQSIFHRVLHDGNWFQALKHAQEVRTAKVGVNKKPWVVLVTGLNGIRKTTSVYQPWFPSVLKQALYKDTFNTCDKNKNKSTAIDSDIVTNIDMMTEADLPSGTTSFFRQLDYMIATVANEDFRSLYSIRDLKEYSSQKDKIFIRYRTVAEMIGILLIRTAQAKGMNIMIETSGRDIAMFNYIDYLFPDTTATAATTATSIDSHSYNKLVIHFTVNELKHAEQSVDTRMAREMTNGQKALLENASTRDIIDINLGGPYGSEVLRGVQADSDEVWRGVSDGSAGVGRSWYKANICVNASSDPAAWTAQAVSRTTNEPIGIAHSFVPL